MEYGASSTVHGVHRGAYLGKTVSAANSTMGKVGEVQPVKDEVYAVPDHVLYLCLCAEARLRLPFPYRVEIVGNPRAS